MCRCTDIMFFQNLPYRASRQLLIPRIAVVSTPFSPLPCKAWHGYMATNAHRVEIEVGADGHASAPLSGAAAAAPPAGAVHGRLLIFLPTAETQLYSSETASRPYSTASG
jgi:hypothetical protein